MNDLELVRLLERAVDHVPIGEPPVGPLLDRGRRTVRRRRTATGVGMAVAVAVVVGAGATWLPSAGGGPPAHVAAPGPESGTRQSPTAAPERPTSLPVGPLPDSGMASCVEEYRPAAVSRRGFAFDGEVVAIGPSVTGGQPAGQPQDLVGVTFVVNEWFRGGGGATVVVDMTAPMVAGEFSTVSAPSYGVGTRLLVSGESRWGGRPLEDPIAWSCGFTRYYDPATAAAWR